MTDGSEIPVFGDGSTERDYTYIDDIVDGVESALDWTVAADAGTFEIMNLGENQTTSLSRLVELIAAELGVKPQLKHLPHQPGDVQCTFADIAKARTMLGYDPHTSIEDGIRRFIEWFRAQSPTDARSGT